MRTTTTILILTPMADQTDWLFLLTSWLSPSYPIGAYSYSHGLEWAVDIGTVRNLDTLVNYAATVMEFGAGWSDLVLAAASWRADSPENVGTVVELGLALRGTREMALESLQQGTAFATVTRAAWPGTKLDTFAASHPGGIVYPVAVGAACAGIVPLDAMLTGLGHAIAANLVSAGVRLVPLGQTDGQRAMAALAPLISGIANRAAVTPLDELGTAAPGIDLYSMRHETQYTRLFRS